MSRERPYSPAWKRNKSVVVRCEERRRKTASMYLEGYSIQLIAEQLQVSPGTTGKDLAKIQAEWKKKATADYQDRLLIEIAKIDQLERRALRGWKRSCRVKNQTWRREEQALEELEETPDIRGGKKAGKPKKPQLRTVKVIAEARQTDQSGDPRFLERMAWCVEIRLKLMGALKPDRDATQQTVNVQINWDQLLAAPTVTTADEIESEIKSPKQLENKEPPGNDPRRMP